MFRNLKALGLAVVAVFAMSAVVASAASAQGVLTSDGPFTLIGENNEGGGPNSLTAFETSEVECPNVMYTGHEVGSKTNLISSGASEVTFTPHYGACTADGFPATVDMNGCDYVLDLGSQVESGTYEVGATVVCPENSNIQVTVFTGASHAIRACTITVTEKEAAYTGLHATDTGNNKIDLEGTATGITSHRSGFGCSNETDEEGGSLHLDVNGEALNSKSETTTLSLSGS